MRDSGGLARGRGRVGIWLQRLWCRVLQWAGGGRTDGGEAAKLGADIRGPLAPRQLTYRLPRPQGVQTQEQHHLQ